MKKHRFKATGQKKKIGVSRKACARTPIFRCRSCFFSRGIGLPLFGFVSSVAGAISPFLHRYIVEKSVRLCYNLFAHKER